MSNVEEEVADLKKFFKHHRIITYAFLFFIAFFTVVFITTIQSLNRERAYTFSSMAAGDSCPYSFVPRGDNSCTTGYFGRFWLQCSRNGPNKSIWSSTCDSRYGASGSACQSEASLRECAKKLCRCSEPTATPIPTAIPTPIAPNCGALCILEGSGLPEGIDEEQPTLCVGGTYCMRDQNVPDPCPPDGRKCPDVQLLYGRCGGPMCPAPTEAVVFPSGPQAPANCRPASCRPGSSEGCWAYETCQNVTGRTYCCRNQPGLQRNSQ